MDEAYEPGVDLLKTGVDFIKTEEKYEEILAKDPSSSTFVFLAQILYRQNKLDRALSVLINGLRYNKNNITGRFLLGKIYYERWIIEPAKKELETVYGLAPDNLAAGKMLVQIYKSEENYKRALEVLRFVHEFHPSDEAIRSEIKELMEKIENETKKDGETPAAWENFSAPGGTKKIEAAESNEAVSETELITETMADLYMKQGIYDKALRVFEKILENDPTNSSVRKKYDESRLRILNKAAGFNKEE